MKKEPGGKETLGVRMKAYEAVTTGASLVPGLPIYARVDMRAGHTWCRGLEKPFDPAYSAAMKAATAYVAGETNAALAMTQSDEASFAWLDDSKVPFGTRAFKLQSVVASMFTAAFLRRYAEEAGMPDRLPSFDCRALNMPSLDEAANMFVWRSQDSQKNSITLLALEHFPHKALQGVNGEEKIRMLAEKGVDYWALQEDLRVGAFFRHELYEKVLTPEETARIPEAARKAGPDGLVRATRSRVAQFSFGMPPAEVANKAGAFFFGEAPVRKERA